ncbi:MAG: SPOR domain-containing protein [Methylococcales bacterium]
MTNELKQRLVGVAVITAIAAIFLPMLFDDPVRESGKAVNELSIPEPPKVAEPEIAPAVTETPQVYPLESTVEGESQEGTEFESNAQLEEPAPVDGTLTPNELAKETEADIIAAKRMTVEELVALKDKKAREKILAKTSEAALAPKEDTGNNLDENKTINKVEENIKTKNGIEASKKIKLEADRIARNEADKKAKDKLAADKKRHDKVEADKKMKAQLQEDKRLADKIAKEQVEYQKLAARKIQEKALAEKKAAEKLALEAKNAAKQQALDDKAAIVKVAADKLAAEKAAANTPVNVRWYIRVGSFGQEANALSLRDKLRKQGYPAVVDTIKSADKGKLYRLRVGPELSKPLAEKMRQKMDAQNNSNSILELQ